MRVSGRALTSKDNRNLKFAGQLSVSIKNTSSVFYLDSTEIFWVIDKDNISTCILYQWISARTVLSRIFFRGCTIVSISFADPDFYLSSGSGILDLITTPFFKLFPKPTIKVPNGPDPEIWKRFSAQFVFPMPSLVRRRCHVNNVEPYFLAKKWTDQTKKNRKNFRIGAKIAFVNENVLTLQSNIFAKNNFFFSRNRWKFPRYRVLWAKYIGIQFSLTKITDITFNQQ